jgi:D-xylose transport system substrate-binding protein
MTVYKPIQKLATRAAGLAITLARNEPFAYDTVMDNKSGTMIPSFIEKPTAVFKHNMDETIIKDGFHSATDVYRNVLHEGRN